MVLAAESPKKRDLRKTVIVLLLLTIIIFLIPSFVLDAGRERPQARMGAIDLSRWSFEQDGPIKLKGGWAFYWQRLVTDTGTDEPDMYLTPRNGWRGKSLPDGRDLPAFGYATYALKISGLKSVPHQRLMIYIYAANTAYRLYAKDPATQKTVPLMGSGTVGTSRQTARPQLKDGMAALPPGPAYELILHNSNYDRRDIGGSIRWDMWLGTEDQIRQLVQRDIFINYSSSGTLFIVGLYLLAVFGLRKTDTASLWLGLFCITLAVFLVADVPYQPFFSSFELLMKLRNLFWPAIALFLQYLIVLYPRSFRNWLIRAFQWLNVGIYIWILSLPVWRYSVISVYDASILGPVVVIVILVLIVRETVLRNDLQTWLILVGAILMAISRLYNTLAYLDLLQIPLIFEFPFLAFALCNALALAAANARTFKSAEDLSSRLGEEKRALEQLNRELKLSEEKLRSSLQEKEILLKEIHHRVKNNLQVIVSLLGLQSNKIKNEELQNSFNVSRNRIKAMSLIHEELYRSENFSHIDLCKYIKHLAADLCQLYSQPNIQVMLKINDNCVLVPIDMAIPCSLIINEIISNSLKYAFPPGWHGNPELSVSVHENDGGAINLLVRDNGIGIPDGIQPETSDTLGLSLISILIKQINGIYSLSRDNGTIYSIAFKRNS